jgi:DNA-binding NarL/FixJ family response regulator
VRVVVVEDHALIADLLAAVCERDFGFTVAAARSSGAAGLSAVREHRPDLVLLDISLPDLDGLDLAGTVRRELPAARILVLSSLRDPATLRRVREIGVHGYVDKREQTLPVLREAIRQVAGGGSYFSPVVAEAVQRLARDPHAFHRVLSPYEQTVLGLIGESLSDAEIAARLNIKSATAQSRRRDIMGKLNIHSTPKLIRYAIENGFTRPEHFPRGP